MPAKYLGEIAVYYSFTVVFSSQVCCITNQNEEPGFPTPLVDLAVSGLWLDSRTLELFLNLNDSITTGWFNKPHFPEKCID